MFSRCFSLYEHIIIAENKYKKERTKRTTIVLRHKEKYNKWIFKHINCFFFSSSANFNYDSEYTMYLSRYNLNILIFAYFCQLWIAI